MAESTVGTARFDADATGTYETPNYVTPKEAPVDRSMETAISAVGQGAVRAGELYVQHKESAFEKKAYDVVDQEIGVTSIEALKNDPELKEFHDQISRTSQAVKVGGHGARVRAMAAIEQLTQEKITQSPWMASIYRRVGKAVLQDRNAFLSLLDEIQENAQAGAADAAKLAQQERKDLVKTGEKYQEQTRLDPGFVISDGTDDEIKAYIRKAQTLAQHAKVADEARQAQIMANSQRAADAAVLGAQAAMRTAAYTDQQREAEQRQLEFTNSIRPVYEAQVNNRYRTLAKTLLNGGSVIDKKALTEQTLAFAADAKARFSEELNSFPWKDPAERDRQFKEFAASVDGLAKVITTFDEAQLQELARLETETKLDAAKSGSNLWIASTVYGPSAVAPAIGRIVQDAETAFRGDLDATIQARGSRALDGWMRYIASGDVTVNGADGRKALKKQAANLLPAYADNLNPIGSTPEELPIVWGRTITAALDGGVAPSEMGTVVTEYFDPGFTARFNKLKSADPGEAQEVAGTVRPVAEQAASSLMREATNLNYDKAISVTPQGFVVDPAFRADRKVQAFTKKLNNTLRVLVDTSVFDGNVQGDPVLFYIENAFGIPVNAEPESVQAQ